jgi:hypothetical protein
MWGESPCRILFGMWLFRREEMSELDEKTQLKGDTLVVTMKSVSDIIDKAYEMGYTSGYKAGFHAGKMEDNYGAK